MEHPSVIEKKELIQWIAMKTRAYSKGQLSNMHISELENINAHLPAPRYEDVTCKGPSRTGGPCYSQEFEKKLGIKK